MTNVVLAQNFRRLYIPQNGLEKCIYPRMIFGSKEPGSAIWEAMTQKSKKFIHFISISLHIVTSAIVSQCYSPPAIPIRILQATDA